jgi:uncharacterized membrane protein (UPF0127 family)
MKSRTMLLVFVFVVICGFVFMNRSKTAVLYINDTAIRYMRADTETRRIKGLSGTRSLSVGEGMLFVYDTPQIPRFWMKDMHYPIDIIWISESKEVTGIEKNISPETFPATYSPDAEVLYVLEVAGGFTESARIDVGMRVDM